MLSRRYKVTQLTADGDLIRVRLDQEGGYDNPQGLNAVVGLRETQITWAIKGKEANGLALGDFFRLTLAPGHKRE